MQQEKSSERFGNPIRINDMCHDKYHTSKRVKRSGDKHDKAVPYKRDKSKSWKDGDMEV